MLELAFLLIALHSPDGREIDVSLDEITSLQCKIPNVENRLFAEGVNSVVNLTDGKYVSVKETCAQIRDQIERVQEEQK